MASSGWWGRWWPRGVQRSSSVDGSQATAPRPGFRLTQFMDLPYDAGSDRSRARWKVAPEPDDGRWADTLPFLHESDETSDLFPWIQPRTER
jgi:hypothetical protein